MQPFNNYPMYQQQYQPLYQPQPYQAQLPSIVGRMINDFNEIRISDIPTDGNPAFFAKRDLSELQARVWATDGSVKTIRFKQDVSDVPVQPSNEDVNERLNQMAERIDKIEKSLKTPATRKKVDENE